MKICSKCNKENRSNPDGLNYTCRKCGYNHDKLLRAEDPRKQLVYGAKQRASKFGLAFNITRSDIAIPAKCPVLGIEIRPGRGKLHRGSPTIDRTDSNKGYVKGNVQVISHRANTLKSNATIAELLQVIGYLKHVDSIGKRSSH